MDVLSYFAADYDQAREKFCEAAHAAGAELRTYKHPEHSPDGGDLTTDVATLGNPEASKVLVANSGTHGVEGFCGSGIQVGWLRSGLYRSLPDDVRLVLIHAINPYGFAWLRRVTEENVDLNRNFIDHNQPHDEDPEYGALLPVMVPDEWDDLSRTAYKAELRRIEKENDKDYLQALLTRGQYQYETGIFFGGRSETWSNRTFHQIIENHIKGVTDAAFIDFHTGLGPYGYVELIHSNEPGSETARRLQSWYEYGLASMVDGTSASSKVNGTIEGAFQEALPGVTTTCIAAEYGTHSTARVLEAVRADNWLHVFGDIQAPLGKKIKVELRTCFFPDEDDWNEMVYLRGRQLFGRTLKGLAASAR
jgi:hypothetical protein